MMSPRTTLLAVALAAGTQLFAQATEATTDVLYAQVRTTNSADYFQRAIADETIAGAVAPAETPSADFTFDPSAASSLPTFADIERYLADHVRARVSPEGNFEDGTVRVAVFVDATGRVAKTVILESPGEALSAEVMRVLAEMPAWAPGTFHGRPSASRVEVEVRFSFR